ncbi:MULTISPECIES: TIGR01777 family oxidoreductase [Legionella]|uniref:TIGR01777 family protein n=1 Tax=Legionella septentrionalis TaxID=2498109 RepID=A0A3S0WZL5_9GAMM|nr:MULTISPECIES: TIGR01777 family oxidoreductase [Legionella]MCP0913687.1 TIGR01777 family oxidoreductase [Legionella sp. 27cVA30]RUQ84466.1 TIGR01777 family protein [Legionella septentrionalis]RUR09269.1 TIGR01777 family protein [Legionella septentrionalis]RUR14463.1 TIGR01777 family protein [Legionella septentrionalis]
MDILIAGASGLIGTALVNHLSKNHNITVLGRSLDKLEHIFSNDINKLIWKNLNNHDATQYDLVVNLSGSNIGAKRWNPTVKKELVESRTLTNQQLIAWLINHHAKPRFYCANAIGIYGAQKYGLESFDEETLLPSSSDNFLQHIGLLWEQSLGTAVEAGIPVTTLRFGVVLKQGAGMLKKLELPFRLGLGSVVGNGEQMLSWIHYTDLVNAIDFLIEHPDVTGAVNMTAPYPIAQKEFAKALARVLKRPLLIRMPDWLIQALFGEMGEYLLLRGQKVIPKRLTELKFKFTYPTVDMALDEEYKI